MISYRAWYDDGSVYEGADWEFAALPDDGFLGCTLLFEDGTRRLMSGNDYYWIAQGKAGPIFANDNMQPDPTRYSKLSVKRGRWTDDATMRGVDFDMEQFGLKPLGGRPIDKSVTGQE
jgi:hypothetical protein